MKVLFPKWSEISREERFFTSMLFHDIQKNPTPMTDLFISDGKLLLGAQTKIQDIGFEVCFFRDAAFAKLIERNQELEKQTFDLFLTLSEQHVIIIEAKAQQCFDGEQMKNLSKAKTLMQARKWPKWPANKISLVALCSSLYSPGEKTKKVFDAFFTWEEISKLYSANGKIYKRADSIYADRRRDAPS